LLARDSLRYRRQIMGLKRYFAGRNCTVVLLDDRTAEGNDLQLESIAHGVIMMESVEREYGIKKRRLEVKKLRGAQFREGFHDYVIQRGGVQVYPRLIASEHLLSFSPPDGIPLSLDFSSTQPPITFSWSSQHFASRSLALLSAGFRFTAISRNTWTS
jgi:hypothetical protein